jgi:hypothetical protein
MNFTYSDRTQLGTINLYGKLKENIVSRINRSNLSCKSTSKLVIVHAGLNEDIYFVDRSVIKFGTEPCGKMLKSLIKIIFSWASL